MAKIRKGDIGTVFQVTIKNVSGAVDISSATTKQIKFRNPSGTVTTKSADFVSDGTDGKLKYTTVSGDLSATGRWKIQSYVELTSGNWHSDIDEFIVYSNLE